jgi:uncharacterized protein YoxC
MTISTILPIALFLASLTISFFIWCVRLETRVNNTESKLKDVQCKCDSIESDADEVRLLLAKIETKVDLLLDGLINVKK